MPRSPPCCSDHCRAQGVRHTHRLTGVEAVPPGLRSGGTGQPSPNSGATLRLSPNPALRRAGRWPTSGRGRAYTGGSTAYVGPFAGGAAPTTSLMGVCTGWLANRHRRGDALSASRGPLHPLAVSSSNYVACAMDPMTTHVHKAQTRKQQRRTQTHS